MAALLVFDIVLRTGESIESHATDPWRTRIIGNINNLVEYPDGTVGLEPSKNQKKEQDQFVKDFQSIYAASVNNYNDFYNEFITQQDIQSKNDQELVDAINKAKQEAWEQTQMVLREQDRLEKERNMEISVATTDRSNRLALEKLIPKSVVRAPVITASPVNLIIGSAIVLTAFALR